MHHTRHLALRFTPHRDHVTAAANRKYRLRQHSLRPQAGDQLAEPLFNFRPSPSDLGAQTGQFVGCLVADPAMLVDNPIDCPGQRLQRVDATGTPCQARRLVAFRQRPAETVECGNRTAQLQQFGLVKDRADLGALQDRSDFFGAAAGQPGQLGKCGERLDSLSLEGFNGFGGPGRLKFQGQRGRATESTVLGQRRQHGRQFERHGARNGAG